MRMLVLAVSAMLGGTIIATPARAEVEFAYCSIAGFGMGQDCMFNTLQQCQAAIRGVGTDCERNPRFTGPGVARTSMPAGTTPRR